MSGTYTNREGLTKNVTDYDPRDDYTDSELAAMDEDGPWARCMSCGWSPDWTAKPHSVWVAENTTNTPHVVQVDPADLNSY